MSWKELDVLAKVRRHSKVVQMGFLSLSESSYSPLSVHRFSCGSRRPSECLKKTTGQKAPEMVS